MIEWDVKNKEAMRRPLSDESVQAMCELAWFVRNPIRTTVTTGAMFGLVLGILRLSAYGYCITTEGHGPESRIVMRPYKLHEWGTIRAPDRKAPMLSRIFMAKLRRWGWDKRGECWAYEFSEAYDKPT